MSMIRNSLGRIVLSFILVPLCLGLAQSTRVERAGLGGRKNSPGLNSIPETTFSCQGRAPGFYADEEHGCQVFHRCHTDRRKDSFLCPNETIFHQRRLVCDWWYNVDCASSAQHVSVNEAIGRTPTRSNEPSTPTQRQPSFTSISNFGQNQRTQSSLSTDSHRDSFRGRVAVPLEGVTKEENIDNQNVGIPKPHQRTRTQSSSSFPGSSRSNNHISKPVSSRTGVALPGLSQNNILSNTETSKIKDKQRNNIHSAFGVPLSAARDNRISPRVTTLSPRLPNQVTISKTQRTSVPLPNANRDKTTKQSGIRKGTFPGRRVTVNKRPISSLSTHRGRDGDLRTGVSLPHFRTPQISGQTRVGNRIPTSTTAKPRQQNTTPFVNVNDKGVAILDERKRTSQFFNIGTPRGVNNKIPITTRTGRPLPATNLKSNLGNRDRINQGNQSPSDISGFQPGRTSTPRKNIGRPLPATNLQSPRQGTRPNNLRQPLATFNQHPKRGDAVRKVANLPGRSRNVNRGTATFQTSLKNRGVINHFNNRNRGSLRNTVQGQNIVIDIDDLDDILDDRFDTHERIDDPFDDDRFDLDDRFDDLDDHLDDRFDDDRFDLDDRFDDDRFDLDDRFDDDRFDLDDRFDDDRFDFDDRFDDGPFDDDRFDFDDDLDDRLRRFGNAANFNFGRRTRGSLLSKGSPGKRLSQDQSLPINITPPSEIQLPPPPL